MKDQSRETFRRIEEVEKTPDTVRDRGFNIKPHLIGMMVTVTDATTDEDYRTAVEALEKMRGVWEVAAEGGPIRVLLERSHSEGVYEEIYRVLQTAFGGPTYRKIG